MSSIVNSDIKQNKNYATRIALRNDVFYRIGTFKLENLDKEPETPIKKTRKKRLAVKHNKNGFCVNVKYKDHWLKVVRPYLKSKENGDIGYIKAGEYTKGLYVGYCAGKFWKGTLAMAIALNLKLIDLSIKKNIIPIKFNGTELSEKEIERFFKTKAIKKIFGANLNKGIQIMNKILAERKAVNTQ